MDTLLVSPNSVFVVVYLACLLYIVSVSVRATVSVIKTFTKAKKKTAVKKPIKKA